PLHHVRGFGPRHCLRAEMLAAFGSELVDPGAPPLLRLLPLGRDPAFLLHPIEGGIERAFFNLEAVAGEQADLLSDGVTVESADAENFENDQIERALEQVESCHLDPLSIRESR